MSWAQRWRFALRYTFAFGQGYLSTFLSALSMLGLVLAISLLIIVFSVMNGFDKEMRERILALVPHITLHNTEPMTDWRTSLDTVRQHPAVEEASAFAQFDTLLLRGKHIETAKGVGLDAADSALMMRLLTLLSADQRAVFLADAEGLVLGSGVAARLGVEVGEKLNLVVPEAGTVGAGSQTRFATVTLSGVLNTQTELDEALALVHLPLASTLAGLTQGDVAGVSGFRVATDDLFAVQSTTLSLLDMLPAQFYGTHWLMTHGNLYAAIQLSRDLVSIILFSIIAVAAFNVVSSLVLVVMDKQGNIAILRTLGATRRDITWIVLLQGAMIGVVGAVVGSLLGALVSVMVPDFVRWLEGLLQMRFLNTDVYPVAFVPVQLLWQDVLLVSVVAVLVCLVAALYPARRAAGLAPARILSQDR